MRSWQVTWERWRGLQKSLQLLLKTRCQPAEGGLFENISITRAVRESQHKSTLQWLFLIFSHKHTQTSQTWQKWVNSVDSSKTEERMRKRREGDGREGWAEQGSWSKYLQCCCFCSEPTHLEVHTHVHTGWVKTHSYLHTQQLVRFSSSINPPCRISSAGKCLSAFPKINGKILAGFALCCSLSSGACVRGRVRGKEREGREKRRGCVLLRWYVCMMHRWRLHLQSGGANHYRNENLLNHWL